MPDSGSYIDDTEDNDQSGSTNPTNSMQFSLGNNGVLSRGCTNNGLEDQGLYEEEESFNILQPNTKISAAEFDYLKVIGRGSFGKVYLVRKKSTQKPYAMKILRKDHLLKKNLLIKT